MATDQPIRAALSAQPFRPFRIRTMDGQIFRVPRPEKASVSLDGGVVVIWREYDNTDSLVAVSQITALEFDK
jgi:hypothetical protein